MTRVIEKFADKVIVNLHVSCTSLSRLVNKICAMHDK